MVATRDSGEGSGVAGGLGDGSVSGEDDDPGLGLGDGESVPAGWEGGEAGLGFTRGEGDVSGFARDGDESAFAFVRGDGDASGLVFAGASFDAWADAGMAAAASNNIVVSKAFIHWNIAIGASDGPL